MFQNMEKGDIVEDFIPHVQGIDCTFEQIQAIALLRYL